MELGESNKKEAFWMPCTPMKPNLAISEPICTDGERNKLNQAKFMNYSSLCTDSVVACGQSSSVTGLLMKMQDQVESASTITSIESESARSCVNPTTGADFGLGGGMGFVDLLALADRASIHKFGTHSGNNNEGKKPIFPDLNSPSDFLSNVSTMYPGHHNVNTINYNIPQDSQGKLTFSAKYVFFPSFPLLSLLLAFLCAVKEKSTQVLGCSHSGFMKFIYLRFFWK